MSGGGLTWIMEYEWWWIDMDHGVCVMEDINESWRMHGGGQKWIMKSNQ